MSTEESKLPSRTLNCHYTAPALCPGCINIIDPWAKVFLRPLRNLDCADRQAAGCTIKCVLKNEVATLSELAHFAVWPRRTVPLGSWKSAFGVLPLHMIPMEAIYC